MSYLKHYGIKGMHWGQHKSYNRISKIKKHNKNSDSSNLLKRELKRSKKYVSRSNSIYLGSMYVNMIFEEGSSANKIGNAAILGARIMRDVEYFRNDPRLFN